MKIRKNLRDNWWEPELEKYNKAYKNIKDYIPIGKDIYDLHAARTSLINGGLKRDGDWTCGPDEKIICMSRTERTTSKLF